MKYQHPMVPNPGPHYDFEKLPGEPEMDIGGMKTEEGSVWMNRQPSPQITGPALKGAPGGGYMQSSVSNTLLGAELGQRGMKDGQGGNDG